MSARSQITGPVAVADDRRDTRLADALFELDAELGQVPGDDPRGAGLLERQLRMPVQIDVEGFEVDGHDFEPSRAPPADVSSRGGPSSRAR